MCKFLPSHAHSCDQAFIHKVLSRFHILTFLHFDIPVEKYLDTPTLGIWNSEMESDQLSGILVFHISAFRHFYDEVFRHFNSRYPGLRNGVYASDLSMQLFLHYWSSLPACFPSNKQAHSCTLHAPLHYLF